jgi:hypothetical protein
MDTNQRNEKRRGEELVDPNPKRLIAEHIDIHQPNEQISTNLQQQPSPRLQMDDQTNEHHQPMNLDQQTESDNNTFPDQTEPPSMERPQRRQPRTVHLRKNFDNNFNPRNNQAQPLTNASPTQELLALKLEMYTEQLSSAESERERKEISTMVGAIRTEHRKILLDKSTPVAQWGIFTNKTPTKPSYRINEAPGTNLTEILNAFNSMFDKFFFDSGNLEVLSTNNQEQTSDVIITFENSREAESFSKTYNSSNFLIPYTKRTDNLTFPVGISIQSKSYNKDKLIPNIIKSIVDLTEREPVRMSQYERGDKTIVTVHLDSLQQWRQVIVKGIAIPKEPPTDQSNQAQPPQPRTTNQPRAFQFAKQISFLQTFAPKQILANFSAPILVYPETTWPTQYGTSYFETDIKHLFPNNEIVFAYLPNGEKKNRPAFLAVSESATVKALAMMNIVRIIQDQKATRKCQVILRKYDVTTELFYRKQYKNKDNVIFESNN